MALVLMGEAGQGAPVGKLEPPLGPLEGLDVRLLVHADDDGVVRGVEVESHDVGGLLGELGIGGHAPAAPALQRDTVDAQDAPHLRGRHVS
jgi:hypothetical protein